MLATNYSDPNLFHTLRLIRSENIGAKTFHALIEMYGTATLAIANLPDLAERGGLKRKIKICPEAKIQEEIEMLSDKGINAIYYGGPSYPTQLYGLTDSPPILFTKGDPSLLNEPIVSIVGSRNCSLNGARIAKDLSVALSEKGYVICSGMARGIDTAAHNGASKMRTIAVLAGDVEHVFPEENRKLYNEICESGLIISERQIGSAPLTMHFPQRNRIISALSKVVVVVEASEKSGSLITAQYAVAQKRKLFAVPSSPLDKRASGCNAIIKSGSAAMLTSSLDIVQYLDSIKNIANDSALDQYRFASNAEPDSKQADKSRDKVKMLISYSEVGVDDLMLELNVSYPTLNLMLLELELAGKIQRVFANKVVRIED